MPTALKSCLMNRARAFDFFGKIEAIFMMCVVMTLYKGVRVLVDADEYVLDIYGFVLPFVSQLAQLSIQRAFFVSAAKVWWVLKIVLMLYYWVVLVSEWRTLQIVNMFVVPIVFCLY
jgi:hypothetical protein